MITAAIGRNARTHPAQHPSSGTGHIDKRGSAMGAPGWIRQLSTRAWSWLIAPWRRDLTQAEEDEEWERDYWHAW